MWVSCQRKKEKEKKERWGKREREKESAQFKFEEEKRRTNWGGTPKFSSVWDWTTLLNFESGFILKYISSLSSFHFLSLQVVRMRSVSLLRKDKKHLFLPYYYRFTFFSRISISQYCTNEMNIDKFRKAIEWRSKGNFPTHNTPHPQYTSLFQFPNVWWNTNFVVVVVSKNEECLKQNSFFAHLIRNTSTHWHYHNFNNIMLYFNRTNRTFGIGWVDGLQSLMKSITKSFEWSKHTWTTFAISSKNALKSELDNFSFFKKNTILFSMSLLSKIKLFISSSQFVSLCWLLYLDFEHKTAYT